MDTQITLADARAHLYKEVASANPNDPLFVQRLNEVGSRFTYSGKWKGTIVSAIYPSPQKFITLSRYHLSVLALRYRKRARPVFSQFLTFSEVGPGELSETKTFPGILLDMGDGYVTQSDIETAGTLRLLITAPTDAGKTVRLFGRDAAGNDIYDSTGALGIAVVLANPVVNTSVVFSVVTGIQAPANMVGQWLLSVVNGITATQIGSYFPGETRPSYRRYQTGEMTEAVQVLCQRRYVPVVAETDWVIPGNMSALRMGLQCMANEFANSHDEAEVAFNRGLKFLNDEAKASRGGAIPTINFHSEFSTGVQIGT